MSEISEEELKKFEKHMGLAQEFKIGDDVFHFKPLTARYIPDLLRVIQKFSDIKEGEEGKWLQTMDEDTSNRLIKLIEKMVQLSYPNLTEEQIDSFVASNFIALSTALLQINDLGAKKLATIKDKLEKLRERKAEASNK